MMSVVSNTSYLSNQSVVLRQAKAKQQSLVKSLVPPLLLFFALGAQLYVRLSIVQRGYEIEELRSSLLKHDTRLRELKLDYSYLTRPGNIIAEAKDKLGMHTTSPSQLRKLMITGNTQGE